MLENSDQTNKEINSEETSTNQTSENSNTETSSEKKETEKAVDEIETKIAETAENTEKIEEEEVDYQSFSLEELVEHLSTLIQEKGVQSITQSVNKIKSTFNVKYGALLKAEKEKFLAEGGNIIDFKYRNPIKSTYNSILYDYKNKRKELKVKQEKELQDNLETKLNLIEELKTLIDNAEGSTMYKLFQGIQERWRNTGAIPRAKYNDTWRTYQFHVERFYDLLHLNNDLRDLDFKYNLEEKLKLVEKAEELAELEDVNQAFKELQILHKIWKEDIGPVSREHREAVWNRFSEATKKVHDKRHEQYQQLKEDFEDNLQKKIEAIELINNYNTDRNKTRGDWQRSMKEIEKLRDNFFSIGRIPRAKNKEVWDSFKEATRKFNLKKNTFFKNLKQEQLDNLNKKKNLVAQAESLKDSEDWDTVTNIMKKIQSDWKKIGHVPRKYSDKLWKDFKDACNHYFDRLHQKQDEGNKEQIEVFGKKKEFLTELKDKIESNKDLSIDNLANYVDEWKDLGRVPYEARHIDAKFNKLMDKAAENNNIDKEDIEMIKFKNLVNGYLEQENFKKLDSEQLFVRKRIEEIEREKQQLENNLSFISNVTEDNPLVKNVRDNINKLEESLSVWKTKMQYLRSLEY